MLNKRNRLNLRFHKNYLHKQGTPCHSPLFTVVYKTKKTLIREKNTPYSRFSILIGKKISKKAVTRNKLKRQLHEILRTNIDKLPKELDILIIPKQDSLKKTYQELQDSLLQAIKRIPCK